MKIKFLYLLPVLLVFLTFSENAFSQNSKPEPQSSDENQQTIEFIDFCTVMKNPEKYHNKIFSTKATYALTFESTTLFSPNCSPQETVVDASLDCNSDDSCAALKQKIHLKGELDDIFGQGLRAELTLTGKFVVNNKNNALIFYIKDVESAENNR
jgi:hypothetical protein